MDQAADEEREWRAMEWMMEYSQQQINNQPLMRVAKVGGDVAVKAKAALAVNGVFPHPVDHGDGGKGGANGRAAVDNIKQWQWQSGINQLKVMVASGVVDSLGYSGMQMTAVNNYWQRDTNGQGQGGQRCASYPLAVLYGWRRQVGSSGGSSQGVKESGPDIYPAVARVYSHCLPFLNNRRPCCCHGCRVHRVQAVAVIVPTKYCFILLKKC